LKQQHSVSQYNARLRTKALVPAERSDIWQLGERGQPEEEERRSAAGVEMGKERKRDWRRPREKEEARLPATTPCVAGRGAA
jgi:hypothetical protein